ncbi:glycosyl-transferase for dystroglycan-domain-containing protein [Halteromyces radiatus]|uniref:glycosyl-transferase for dystroglycan-domain-containing protein n=1 Tax=Halteromyces radiatus TaxID=101107 RepID=UPI00221FF132|nr:glycosyl-transferase for dystroglycan-domain-containing protein [Halteromyces radiatus]KAI8078874.1 glycosyl-transferase for dystroglycan-domain-containing protein [Halteromyces radiatus]
MREATTKLIQVLVFIYAFISVIYTVKYFYSSYHSQQDGIAPYYNHHEAQAQELQSTKNNDVITNNSEKDATVVWHGSQSTMRETFIMSKIFADAMQPSQLTPYYYKAKTIKMTDITMATLVTRDRFPVLSRLASNYKGPISAAIHINDDEEKEATLQDLATVYKTNPDMQKYVDVHLVVDTFDRQFNLWRNVAKLFARTDYVMMLDVDFHLCTNLQSLRENPERLEYYMNRANGRVALVVPAFEYVAQADGVDYKTFPTTKQALLDEMRQGKIDMFHKGWKKGHGATDYERWYTTNESYVVTDYDFSYEPYIIYPKEGTPWCDERFIGYGANKAACLFEIYLSGMEYTVLPDDFLIHQTHKYPEKTRRKERQYNRTLYSNFREELCLRYARMFMASGEWDSGRADNLKKECAKNRGYRTAMKSIL